ncbi:MAG: Unknown protein [uncultured Sulfurovum sp.]|uniref:Uncharacterized protein n=1 Tax=uncultured Sulfurovum sp. TaxID=269237 RepID=A0A6S6SPJ6_9BACT|nr:MAG: Unknown protein [uncultured Sulfurovum sp.]
MTTKGKTMQTVQIEVEEDKLELFLTIIQNLKKDIVKNIKLPNNLNTLDIESIEKDSEDYQDIQAIKAQNNPKYSIEEAKKQLGL